MRSKYEQDAMLTKGISNGTGVRSSGSCCSTCSTGAGVGFEGSGSGGSSDSIDGSGVSSIGGMSGKDVT